MQQTGRDSNIASLKKKYILYIGYVRDHIGGTHRQCILQTQNTSGFVNFKFHEQKSHLMVLNRILQQKTHMKTYKNHQIW